MRNSRRSFIGALGAGTLTALAPFAGSAASARRVVVVGGGMAGATMAKFLRLWSGRTIDVTLVTPSANYTSNIMSNLVVTGQVAYSALNFTYAKLQSLYGVKVEIGSVTAVAGFGGGTGSVTVVNGPSIKQLTCERLVLAPGIELDAVPLTGAVNVPAPVLHAWQAGQQTLDLQKLLAGMSGGQTFVMSIPPSPYRCPPGPYERACVVADYLKRTKPGAKIVVLDANPGIVAEPHNFGTAFAAYKAAGVLEYLPNASVVSVSQSATAGLNQTVTADIGGVEIRQIAGNVVNVIPPHRAPKVVRDAGLVPSGERFAPVSILSFESTLRAGIHVIGDAAKTTLPKAGHVGNQEAKICANAIVNAFNGLQPDPSPTANSACFSPISNTHASWLTAVYQIDKRPGSPNLGKMVIWDGVLDAPAAGPTEAAAPSTQNFSQMGAWYKVLMSDTFA